jgi:2-methylcitrate dehydratase PrpD
MEHTKTLAQFVAGLRYEDLPATVVDRAKLLVLDTLAAPFTARASSRPAR